MSQIIFYSYHFLLPLLSHFFLAYTKPGFFLREKNPAPSPIPTGNQMVDPFFMFLWQNIYYLGYLVETQICILALSSSSQGTVTPSKYWSCLPIWRWFKNYRDVLTQYRFVPSSESVPQASSPIPAHRNVVMKACTRTLIQKHWKKKILLMFW